MDSVQDCDSYNNYNNLYTVGRVVSIYSQSVPNILDLILTLP
jgi:hypothetical protein